MFQHMPTSLLKEVQATIVSNRQQAAPVVRIKANSAGRDFIVGDIHGAFNLVRQAMRAVNFDQSKDRLFSCGDLVDRGSESTAAARFLAASFVNSIMGNHEWDLLDVYAGLSIEGDGNDELAIQALAKANWNGMRWLGTTTPDERAALLRAFSKLPLAMEVETPRGLVGIVHGEAPIGMDWTTFRQGLMERDKSITDSCLTGRERIKRGRHELVKGIDRIFCGHTPQFQGAQRLGNIFYVDSGAVFSQMDGLKDDYPGASLTMAGLVFSTGALLERNEGGDIRLLDGPGIGPFNSSWLTCNAADGSESFQAPAP